MSPLSPAQAAVHRRLTTDLFYYAKKAPLYIKTKLGRVVPWVPNTAQRYIHDCVEAQKRRLGWVRVVIVKGRQQGSSTYIELRIQHAISRTRGLVALLISHEKKSTKRLLEMVKRAWTYTQELLRPTVGIWNESQVTHPSMESEFNAETARNDDAGRSGTAQVVHWSEAAYCEGAEKIVDSALQSIVLGPGTEIFLESTANGPYGLFYQKVQDAIKGVGVYELIFVPWFWQDEYELEPAPGFELTEAEEAYAQAHMTRTFPYHTAPISRVRVLRKMAWRRMQIVDLTVANNPKTGLARFRQFYPATVAEAFQASGDGLMSADAIMAARTATVEDESAPLILGVDPAGDSDHSDRTVIFPRGGRAAGEPLVYPKMKPMELAGIIARLIRERNPVMVFVDNAKGEGTVDRLHEMGYTNVQGVWFGEGASNPDKYLNKRSEMIITMATWVNGGGVSLPDREDVHADLAVFPPCKETSNGLQYIVSKDELKKKLNGRSTDLADALALTFAYPVQAPDPLGNGVGRVRKVNDQGGGKSVLKSRAFFNRRRGG